MVRRFYQNGKKRLEKDIGMSWIKISLVGICLILVGSSLAVKHVGRDWSARRRRMGLIERLRYLIEKTILRSFSMVGGYLCSTYPDESRGPCDESDPRWVPSETECIGICPSSTKGGCVIDFWDEDWNYKGETTTSPGGWYYAQEGWYWEVYYCNIECTCTDFSDGGCGANGCASNEMWRVRDCVEDPDTGEPCAEEEVCVFKEECEEEECEPHYEKRCQWGDVYWYDSCGDREEIYEECGANEECVNGNCEEECEPHYEKRCQWGDVYWYDSCGDREEIYEECGDNEECAYGNCVSTGPAGTIEIIFNKFLSLLKGGLK